MTEDYCLRKRGEGSSKFYFFHTFNMFDPMSELGGGEPATDDDAAAPADDAPAPAPSGNGGGNGSYAQEVHSVTIHARQRTFYIDLKESSHGKFFKVSEKSRGGQKSTIMFDAEDLDQFIEAFGEMKTKLA